MVWAIVLGVVGAVTGLVPAAYLLIEAAGGWSRGVVSTPAQHFLTRHCLGAAEVGVCRVADGEGLLGQG